MSDDLVHRLRTEWVNDDGTLCELAADRIEALERAIWTMHGEANEHIKRIESLEAALREIAILQFRLEDRTYPASLKKALDIASRALEGKS